MIYFKCTITSICLSITFSLQVFTFAQSSISDSSTIQISPPLPEIDSSPVTSNTITMHSLNTPNRPIAQTAVGIALTANAVIGLVFGAVYSSYHVDDDNFLISDDLYRDIGKIFFIEAACTGAAGITFLSIATTKWNIYNEWEKNNKVSFHVNCTVPLKF